MKKKLLSLLLMICMAFPTLFMVGCGEDSATLGGKTLVPTTIEEIDWTSEDTKIEGFYLDNSTYTTYSFTYDNVHAFLNAYGNAEDASGERVVDWGDYADSDIADIADQKAIIALKAFKALTFDGNVPVFSKTAEKLYIYEKNTCEICKNVYYRTYTLVQ